MFRSQEQVSPAQTAKSSVPAVNAMAAVSSTFEAKGQSLASPRLKKKKKLPVEEKVQLDQRVCKSKNKVPTASSPRKAMDSKRQS